MEYTDADAQAETTARCAGSRSQDLEGRIEKALTSQSWDRAALEQIAAEIARDIKECPTTASFEQLVARARLLHILTELEPDPERRQPSVETGVSISRELMDAFPAHVESPYYLAIFLGRQAQKQGLSALATVKKVEKLALSAVEKDPAFDSAGPLRFLAMLYIKAPAWPVSIGDIDAAREYAVQAVKTDDVPINWIVLAEVLAEDGETEKARQLLTDALDAKAARPSWERAKVIWEPRARELLRRID